MPHAPLETYYGTVIVCSCGTAVILPGTALDVEGAFSAHTRPLTEIGKKQKSRQFKTV